MLSYDIHKLERARVVKGWTKTTLAQRVGLVPSAITAIWQGKNKNAETMKQIADVLGLSVEEILVEEVPAGKPTS